MKHVRLAWSTALILLLAMLGLAAMRPENTPAVKPIDVKVLVLNFNPIFPQHNGKRLHEVGRWQDPRDLAAGYVADTKEASKGLIQYQIVDWKDIDGFPVKTDGFTYTKEEYLKCHVTNKGWHQPDGTDYPKVLAQFKIVERIESGEVDEVWWFGGPYFGYYESAMAGQGAFYINGGVFDKVPCKRAFAIMGFNYERGVAEMLHDLCHRTESTMSRVFGGWQADKLDHDWARYAANAHKAKGMPGVGDCHFPPNAQKDYDYTNKRFVESAADDWLNYPHLKGATKQVNCETWGGPDYHRNYMKWWFARLPRAPGINAQNGRLNNWWEYVFNFNRYDEQGKLRK